MDTIPPAPSAAGFEPECPRPGEGARAEGHRSRGSRFTAPGRVWGPLLRWLPAVASIAVVVTLLGSFGVSPGETAVFAGYLVLGVTLPGMLVIRALWSGRRALAEEIALGAALGYTAEVLIYIVGRAAGVPLLAAAWPVGTYLLFCAVPRLRRHWRGTVRLKAPLWWSWSLSLIFCYLLLVPTLLFFSRYDIARPGFWADTADMPYHLALIGELKHHMLPTIPTVAGEPLLYHWFVYAHFAASSWITGLEPAVLLFRLAMLPMFAALLLLLGMTGRRVTGSWAGGLLCVVGALFLKAPNLHQGVNWTLTYGGLQDVGWVSPTQTFGALLFAPLVLLLLDLLQRRRHGAGRWALLVVFLVGVMGAKATYLPLLGAGLVMVVMAEVIVRRRIAWHAVIALGMTGVCFLFAQLVLFGGARLGLIFDPLHLIRAGWMRLTDGGPGVQPEPSGGTVLGFAVLYALGWTVAWSGAFGLLARYRMLMRPGVLLLIGIGAAGLGVALLFGHPGFSQLFFLMAALPYLATVAVYGLTVLVRRARVPRGAVLVTVGAGVAVAFLLRALLGVGLPLGPGGVVTTLFPPYAVLLAVTALAVVVLAVRMGARKTWALMTVAFMALSLPGEVRDRVTYSRVFDPAKVFTATGRTPVAEDAFTVLRWLRDHSHPDELVATNAHCRWGRRYPCQAVRLWVSAFSERRVLVEGWAYTSRNLERWRPGESLQNQFWDRKRFAANQAAFDRPSPASIRRLGKRYEVRWLFVDERQVTPAGELEGLAEKRFSAGDYAVYAIPDDAER